MLSEDSFGILKLAVTVCNLELKLAAVASRSSIAGALLRTSLPQRRHAVVNFLRGLSRDELECLAEFEGACMIESLFSPRVNPYEILINFFGLPDSSRTGNDDDAAHKTCILLKWLECAGIVNGSRDPR